VTAYQKDGETASHLISCLSSQVVVTLTTWSRWHWPVLSTIKLLFPPFCVHI
jgi:hypothetical protein